jgi:uncharacterized membrane protein (DUF485 family)
MERLHNMLETPCPSSSSKFFCLCNLSQSSATMLSFLSVIQQLYQARWYIVALLIASYIAQEIRAYRRLSHIKGPWFAQFSQLWLLTTIYQQKAHYVFDDVRKKYGAWLKLIIDELTGLTICRKACTDWDQHVDHLRHRPSDSHECSPISI